jgi:ribosomal protein L24
MRTKTQNRWIAALIPALALVLASYAGPGAAYAASAGDQIGPMGRIIATETTTATATVQAVDRAKRTVTLRSPDGTTSIYRVPKEAVNFDQIEVGDQVRATLVESLAVALRKADEPPSAGESQAVALAPKGAKPGGIIVDTAELTARVTAVDTAKRTVTLVGPAGNRRTLKVGPNVDLTKVQPGDNVVVRYTEALALTVEKPSGATVQPSSARVPAPEEGAAGAAAPIEGLIVADATTATATVQAVDREKRTVTLRNPDGTTSTYKLSKHVINFDEIEVGDQVRATTVDSLAVVIRKADEPPSIGEEEAVALAPKGAKPGVVVANTAELTATIKAIDRAQRTVTLAGPAGSTRTLKVGPDVDLTKVQPGDNVVVRYTQAVALMVEKPSEATVQPSSARVPATGNAANAASAGKQAGPMGKVIATETTTETATVQAVDHTNRTVTLRSTDGTTSTYKVPKEAVNFDQIKVGDQVKATEIKSLAVAIREANEPPSAGETQMVTLAPKGAMPGGIVVNTIQVTARVTAIDTAKRMVTVVGPAGNTRRFEVGPNVDLTKVHPGDNVVVRYTEAVALQVERPSEATVRPAAAQIPATREGGLQAQANLAVRIVEARKANAALMRQYTWQSRTELIDKGEIRDIRLDQVTYGPDGSLQRVVLNNQGASLPHGFLRRSIAENKKKEMEEYLTGLRGLLDQYTLPTAGKVLDFMTRATTVGPDASGLIMMTGSGVVLPGDNLTIWTDAATRQTRKVQVKTYFQNDGVELTATFQTLPGGPTHVAFAEVIVPAKQLTVQVQNFNYVRTASTP